MKNWAGILMPVWSLALGLALVMVITDNGHRSRYPVISIPNWYVTQPPGSGSPEPSQTRRGTLATENAAARIHPFAFESSQTTPVTAKKDLPPLRLTLIAVAGSKKICRINGQLFMEGQKGNGFQVLRIDNTHVEIMFDTDRQPIVLYLHPPEEATHVQ